MSNPKVDSIVAGFLEYLKKDGSLNLLSEIIRKLESRANDYNLSAKVLSSSTLSKNQTEKILKVLNANFGIKNAEFEVDNSLLGGIKVSIGDNVIDLSLQNKLSYLSKSI